MLLDWWKFGPIKQKYKIGRTNIIYNEKSEYIIELKVRDLLFLSTFRYLRLVRLSSGIIQSNEVFAFGKQTIRSKEDFDLYIQKNDYISTVYIIITRPFGSSVHLSFLSGSDIDPDIIENSKRLISDLVIAYRSKKCGPVSKERISPGPGPALICSSKHDGPEKDPYFDPYEILGIPYGASVNEIKKAFRKKVKEFHPDLANMPFHLKHDPIRRFLQTRLAYEHLMKIKDEFYTV